MLINVVIAEDDYRIGNIHEKFIDKVDGFHVIGKTLNGEDTLKLLEEKDVDLLLLDIYMPDILGSELMSIIRKKEWEVDVIVISAATEVDIVEQAIRYGALDYIIKPVEINRFITTLTNYKKLKDKFTNEGLIDQNILDHYFGFSNNQTEHAMTETPKGIDPLTLEKVKHQIKQYRHKGVTAEELGEMIGVTRTTARRYLEYLISKNIVRAELEYGSVGRPERRYRIIN